MSVIVKDGGGKPEEEKTVTAGTSVIEVLPSSGKTMKKVTVNPTPTEEKTVTPTTSQQTVSPSNGKHLAKVIVKAIEDVTPEVTAQTPIIAEIAEKFGVSITTPSGTNKQILQGNNANLQNINENGKGGLPNGAVWSLSNIVGCKFYYVCYGNGIFVASSKPYQGTGLYYSYDGKTWTQSNITEYGMPVYYKNGIFIGLGSSYSKGLYYSTDGITWTQSNITSYYAYDEYCCIYDNGVFVVGTDNGLYYSTDGITWTQSNITSGLTKAIKSYNGFFVAGCNNKLYYSTNGITWTASSNGARILYIYHTDAGWLACGQYVSWYSNDGITWTETNVNIKYAEHYNGLWVGSGEYVYYSTDGVTWTQSNITSGGDYLHVYHFKNIWLVISINGIIYYSYDGRIWSAATDNKSFSRIHIFEEILVATGEGIYFSKDGVVWTQSNITMGSFSQSCNANGILAITEYSKGYGICCSWNPVIGDASASQSTGGDSGGGPGYELPDF